jgi:Uma2 family endonuclease
MISPLQAPLLKAGDRLDQPTFHERYLLNPEVRAELVQGIVFMPAAAQRPHGRMHSILIRWLWSYEGKTPGLETFIDTTAIMGPRSEPQPDITMIVLPEKGGQMRVSERYEDCLEGAPELVVEVSASSEAHDLTLKKADYEREGVCEYIVVAIRQRRVYWFVNRDGVFQELAPESDGFLKSEVFPGLWLDPAALLDRKVSRVLAVAELGLATPEHAQFVAEIAKR